MRKMGWYTPAALAALKTGDLFLLMKTDLIVLEDEWGRLTRQQRKRVLLEVNALLGEIKLRGTQLRMF